MLVLVALVATAIVGIPARAADRAVVADTQRELAALGYKPGPADGLMGSRTRSAIERYQERYGLRRDGEPSPELLVHIRSTLRAGARDLGAGPAQAALPALPDLPAATPVPAAGGEGAVVLRDSALRSRPLTSAPPRTRVAEGERVEVLQLKGRWSEVRLPGGSAGWMVLADLRLEAGAGQAAPAADTGAKQGRSGAGFFRSITGALSPSRSTSTSSAGATTVGIRGLGSADIANARPDMDAVHALDGYRVDAGGGRLHAREQGLHARDFAYLPAPQSFAAARGSDN